MDLRVRFGLAAALWAAVEATCAAPDLRPQEPRPPAATRFACFDPADPGALRRLQDEPCRPPLLHLPRSTMTEAAPNWPSYAPRDPADVSLHAPFWRFPVQPPGPHEAPRHGR